MATREELLKYLWQYVINVNLNIEGLNKFLTSCEKHSNAPFSDAGAAIQRMLDAGVSMQDICSVRRCSAYEAVFSTLHAIGDPGVDDEEDIFMLFESLLASDPSGLEGRQA